MDTKKTTVSARLQVYVQGDSGPEPKTRTVRAGDDLHALTGLDAYAGFVVEELDAGWGEVRFANGIVVEAGEERGPDHEIIARVQIAHTIEEHMRKAHRLRRRGIKVLSLFFIDYDQVIVDSVIERDFALELEAMDEVKLFIKLPAWFTVPTPIGTYNPDWAIVFAVQDAFGEVRETLYLVSETKGTLDEEQRRGTENLKIACARRHFKLLSVPYLTLTTAHTLRPQARAVHQILNAEEHHQEGDSP